VEPFQKHPQRWLACDYWEDIPARELSAIAAVLNAQNTHSELVKAILEYDAPMSVTRIDGRFEALAFGAWHPRVFCELDESILAAMDERAPARPRPIKITGKPFALVLTRLSGDAPSSTDLSQTQTDDVFLGGVRQCLKLIPYFPVGAVVPDEDLPDLLRKWLVDRAPLRLRLSQKLLLEDAMSGGIPPHLTIRRLDDFFAHMKIAHGDQLEQMPNLAALGREISSASYAFRPIGDLIPKLLRRRRPSDLTCSPIPRSSFVLF
jgi:hypothetical protein